MVGIWGESGAGGREGKELYRSGQVEAGASGVAGSVVVGLSPYVTAQVYSLDDS
jgi:hypothetical protein